MHLETVSITATAPGAGGAAGAAVTGDSLTIKNARPGSAVRALSVWYKAQGAGFIQITTPSGHDTSRGARMSTRIAADLLTPIGHVIPFVPQEALSVTIAGSATAGDVEQVTMLNFYEDMPGIDCSKRLKRWDEVAKRMVRPVTVDVTLTGSAGPGYSGAELITAESNLLRAYSNYALLGITCQTDHCTVGIVGPDTGNQRVSVPGIAAKQELTAQWFALLSRAYDLPTIPIINSGNKDSTSIFMATDENSGSPRVTLHLGLIDGEI